MERGCAGKIDETVFVDMVRRYLASIPGDPSAPVKKPQDVAPLGVTFATRPAAVQVPVRMMEPRAQVQVTFPVEVLPHGFDNCEWRSTIVNGGHQGQGCIAGGCALHRAFWPQRL